MQREVNPFFLCKSIFLPKKLILVTSIEKREIVKEKEEEIWRDRAALGD